MALTEVSAFKNLSIATDDIADDAITLPKIANSSVTTAKIANLTIVNNDISNSAAIAGTKISPDFGSQNITTTGQFQSTGSGTSTGLKISNAYDSVFLFFVNNNDNSDFYISYGNSGGPEIKLGHDGKVSLSHAGTTRIQTTTVGASITGNLAVTGTVDSVDLSTYQADGGSYLRSDADDSFSGTITAISDTANPVIKIRGSGPNFIQFASDASGTVDADSINIVYRTTPNTLAFERVSDAQIMFSVDADDQQAVFNGNVDCTSGLDVSGGDITGVLGSAVTGTTQSASDNSTKIATTAYVDNAVSSGGGGGGISNIVEDTTPQLGGDLDVNGHDIILENQDSIKFKRDGTTKLEIKTMNGNQQFNAGSKGVEFNVAALGDSAFKINDIGGQGSFGANIYFQLNRTEALFGVPPRPKTDDAVDLGSGTLRWDNVYATNAAIQSSDQNLKQDIQALTTAEKAVATTLKGLIKTFKYKKAVAAKGDKARIHCGVIAQEVKAAFEAQGLKAEDYGLFCYDEWDAIPEEKDEDGNITKLAVPAGNRYSIRYTELLAFIISVL